jgi:hypothetical protein
MVDMVTIVVDGGNGASWKCPCLEHEGGLVDER